MKRTGAKNYRYTDDHWQSVPTRARFLCFGSNTPGRQFRENSRERARRSPGIDVQESDPPLPFAWQTGGGTGARDAGARACGLLHGEARKPTCHWDFSTAKRETGRHWDFSTAKRESRPCRWDFSTAKRESRRATGFAGAHGAGRRLPAGHTGPGRAAAFRRGTRGRAGRREKASSYARKAGLPVLRVSQTTQKLRRLLSCFFARKER